MRKCPCGAAPKYLKRGLCNACYQRARKAGVITSSLVDADSAGDHLRDLMAAGWGYRRIESASGVCRSLLWHILAGRSTIAAKTRDAILSVEVVVDEYAIAHRELCMAGARGDYVSPQRKHRHARIARLRAGITSYRRTAGMARELDATIDELLTERAREKPLPFAERYVEMADFCGLDDERIAQRMGVNLAALERNKLRHARAINAERTAAI